MSKLSKYPPKGFTLIELLVVVLIIGILAAIALPQYRRIVEKSRASEALTLMSALNKAIDVYYLINSEYPKYFSDLDIEIPWTGSEPFYYDVAVMSDFISNNYWSIGLEHNPSGCDGGCYTLLAARLDGYYKGGGFIITKRTDTRHKILDSYISCIEYPTGPIQFGKDKGEFCFGIMNAKSLLFDEDWGRAYSLK